VVSEVRGDCSVRHRRTVVSWSDVIMRPYNSRSVCPSYCPKYAEHSLTPPSSSSRRQVAYVTSRDLSVVAIDGCLSDGGFTTVTHTHVTIEKLCDVTQAPRCVGKLF
jgi:hypothetical protein